MSNLNQFNEAALNTEEQNNTNGGKRRGRERLLNRYRPSNRDGYLAPLSDRELQGLGGRAQTRILKQYNRRVRYYNNRYSL